MPQPIFMPDYGYRRQAQGQQAFLQAMQMQQSRKQQELQRQHQMDYLGKSNSFDTRLTQMKAINSLNLEGYKQGSINARTEFTESGKNTRQNKTLNDPNKAYHQSIGTDDSGKQYSIRTHKKTGEVFITEVPGITGKSQVGRTGFDVPATKQRKLDEMTVSTQNALKLARDIVNDLDANPTIIGLPGKAQRGIVSFFKQAKNTAIALGGTAELNGQKVSDDTFVNHYIKKDVWDNMQMAANQSAAQRASLVRLAYAVARSMEPGGRLTDQDFNRALEQVGGRTGDKGQMKSALTRTMGNTLSSYKHEYRTFHGGRKETDFSEIDTYGWGPPKGGGTTPPKPDTTSKPIDLSIFMED